MYYIRALFRAKIIMAKKIKIQSQTMKELLVLKDEKIPQLLQAGELIKGRIIEIGKIALLLDLGALGTGIVYGAELKENRDLLKGLKLGDTVSALVLDSENEDGYVELSLRGAHQQLTWEMLKKKKQDREIITTRIIQATRGGLIVSIDGLSGFLPVSQLSSQKYPQIEGGDRDKILSHLNRFINQEIKVMIIGLDQSDQQIIVSEKAAPEEKPKEKLKEE